MGMAAVEIEDPANFTMYEGNQLSTAEYFHHKEGGKN